MTIAERARALAATGLTPDRIAAQLVAEGSDPGMAENQATIAVYALSAVRTPDPTYRVKGLPKDPFTRVPHDIIDRWAPRLGEAELRVLLYIIRRTVGFGASEAPISLTQFSTGLIVAGHQVDNGTGMSKRAIITGLRALEKRGLIQYRKTKRKDGGTGTADVDVDLTVDWARFPPRNVRADPSYLRSLALVIVVYRLAVYLRSLAPVHFRSLAIKRDRSL